MIDARALRELSSALDARTDRRIPSQPSMATGTVTKAVSGDWWVRLDGSQAPTPCQQSTVNVTVGDRVTVRTANGTATITGNVSQPAQTAQTVSETVTPVRDTAETALGESARANAAANQATADAARANAAATQATKDAATANAAATQASADAAAAKAQAELATSDAAKANAAANQATKDARTAADNAAASGIAASLAQSAAQSAQRGSEKAAADAAAVREAYERGDFYTPVLDLVSTNGNVFRNGDVATTLRATVRYAGKAITDADDLKATLGGTYHLRWGVSQDGGAVGYLSDQDKRITPDGFGLEVTKEDVGERATFFCELMSE